RWLSRCGALQCPSPSMTSACTRSLPTRRSSVGRRADTSRRPARPLLLAQSGGASSSVVRVSPADPRSQGRPTGRDKTDPMGTIHVSAERRVDASAETVYGYLADMREHHPRFLPPAFSNFEVESGGVGAGTVTRAKMPAGGPRLKMPAGRRSREYRMEVADPEPGRVL